MSATSRRTNGSRRSETVEGTHDLRGSRRMVHQGRVRLCDHYDVGRPKCPPATTYDLAYQSLQAVAYDGSPDPRAHRDSHPRLSAVAFGDQDDEMLGMVSPTFPVDTEIFISFPKACALWKRAAPCAHPGCLGGIEAVRRFRP